MVATGPDLLASKQLETRGYFWQADLPGGAIKMPGTPYVVTGAELPRSVRGPTLGEHNAALLGELGLTGHDLMVLNQQGAM